eukprot:COSAG01_NODE_2898_length_6893_cov_45.927878_2_plen_171_part_00
MLSAVTRARAPRLRAQATSRRHSGSHMPGTHGGRNRRAHQLRAQGVLAHSGALLRTSSELACALLLPEATVVGAGDTAPDVAAVSRLLPQVCARVWVCVMCSRARALHWLLVGKPVNDQRLLHSATASACERLGDSTLMPGVAAVVSAGQPAARDAGCAEAVPGRRAGAA